MRNFWLPSHLHNSSQVIEVEKGQAAKHKTDKSISFTLTALNIFALEVIPPPKNWRWRRERWVERAGACWLSPFRWNRVCRVFVRSALAPALLPAACVSCFEETGSSRWLWLVFLRTPSPPSRVPLPSATSLCLKQLFFWEESEGRRGARRSLQSVLY